MTRRYLFLLAWPLRALLALFALTFGALFLWEYALWQDCKRDVRGLLKAWPQ